MIGTLLGSVDAAGRVTVKNSYAVPHNEQDGQVFVDVEFHRAMAELHAFGQHALAVARAAVADCERCAAAHAVRELRSRGRALLLGLPAAAAYAAVAQQSQTRRRLGTHGSRRPMKAARLLRAALRARRDL